MPACCAFGCDNRTSTKSKKQLLEEQKTKISFHKFPKNPERRNVWLKAIRRIGWTPTDTSVVCSEHFAAECFDRTSLSSIRLRDTAIPSIFKSFPTYLQKKQKKCRKPPVERKITGITPLNVDDPQPGTSGEAGETIIQVEASSSYTESVTEESVNKNENIRKLMSRTTSFSPLRKTRRELSPMKTQLRKKMNEMKVKYQRKIKLLQQARRRHIKKIASMQNILKSLRTKHFLQDEQLEILKNVSGSNAHILKRQIAKSTKSAVPRQYSAELRKFSVTLHYFSPSAYNYVRKSFDSCLPHPKTISKWYRSVNGEPGFTAEAFVAIKNRCEYCDYPLVCSLSVDEMAIRRRVEFDGQKYHGFVEYGIENLDDNMTEAKEALVFMIVCVNDSWKIPVGYFLVDTVNSEQKSNLIQICVQKCHEAGIRVISITFDGAASNISMMYKLGCNLNKKITYFSHPETHENIYFYPDPCHMIKNVRNAFGDKKIFFDVNNRKIDWAFLEKLQELQTKEGFHLANKVKNIHIQYKKQIMKVRLATQLLSESTACALEYCEKLLRLPEFQECSATIEYIRVFNNLFDIFNSKNMKQYSLKQPLSVNNFSNICNVLDYSINYIENLKCEDGSYVIKSGRKTGFIGFLICINTVKELYADIITKNNLLKYLPTYKLNQDHLEIFFSVIRSKGGWNNNPTSRQFKAAYKKILIHSELHETRSGNCIPLEAINILHCSSSVNKTNAVQIINSSTSIYRQLEKEEEDLIHVNLETDHIYYNDPQQLTEFSNSVISYISGFVVRNLKKEIVCETCLNVLERDDDHENKFLNFIHLKDKGHLIYPSDDVINICKVTEKIIKQALLESGGKFLKKKYSILYLTSSVLKYYLSNKIFKELENHALEQSGYENHVIQLIRAIAEKYLRIRLYYILKARSEDEKSDRQRFNKFVLFSGH